MTDREFMEEVARRLAATALKWPVAVKDCTHPLAFKLHAPFENTEQCISCGWYQGLTVSPSTVGYRRATRAERRARSITGPSPADKLADAVREAIGPLPVSRRYTDEADVPDFLHELETALSLYDSTRNGAGRTTTDAFGSPPDPILVARYLLDALTGGALASLICWAQDEGISTLGEVGCPTDNLKSTLRALGEKIG